MKKNRPAPFVPERDLLEAQKKYDSRRSSVPEDPKPPHRPDWLVIFISILLLLTILIALLTGMPSF